VSGGFDLIAEVAAPSRNELDTTIDVIGEAPGRFAAIHGKAGWLSAVCLPAGM